MATTHSLLVDAVSATAVAALIAATLHDIGFRTVPNWMSLVIAGAGMLLHVSDGDALAAAACAVAVGGAAAWCWHRGWLGGGDVKLFAAVAVLVPPALVPGLLVDVALAGGALALIYLVLSRLVRSPSQARPASLPARVWRAESWRIRRRGPLPYASAIAAGALLVLLKG